MKVLVSFYIFFECIIFIYTQDLAEGSECTLENGQPGICKKIPECPPKLEEARQGRRSALSARCGFVGWTEVVCCPIVPVKEKINVRTADVVCQEYQNEVYGVHRPIFHVLAGIEASSEEFPYMVALGYADKNNEEGNKLRYTCGGTLISSRFVLTAAHCVNNIYDSVPIMVRMGSVDLEDDSEIVQKIPVKEVIPHPDYKRSEFYNDIALIKLSHDVRWTNTVQPCCLQTKSVNEENPPKDVHIIVAGWGGTDLYEDTSNKLMRSPGLTLVPRTKCTTSYQRTRQIPNGLEDNMICAIDSNTTRRSDACQGDSGGPLLMLSNDYDTIIGVISFGQSCGTPIPAVYTSVHSFIDWIEKNVWADRVRK